MSRDAFRGFVEQAFIPSKASWGSAVGKFRLSPFASACLLSLLWALPAAAVDGLGFKMVADEANPFPYFIDDRPMFTGQPTIQTLESAVQNAWRSWQDISCASTAFQYKGRVSGNLQIAQPNDVYDPYNVTAQWVTAKTDSYYDLALGGGVAVGGALTISYGGLLATCDVYLNAVDHSWSSATPTPAGLADIETVLVHEYGHCQGLAHTNNPTDVMYTRYDVGTQHRSLSTADRQTLCEFYPVEGAVGSPCLADGGCANVSSKCIAAPRADGGTFPKMCSKGCAAPSDCPDPYQCKPSSLIAGSASACVPTDQVTLVGAECQFPSHCGGTAEAVCLTEEPLPSGYPLWDEGYCSQPCGSTLPACPSGSSCINLGGTQGQRCMRNCRYYASDCRPAYSCSRPQADAGHVCLPSCHADADCPSTHQCRPCDGLCIPKNKPGAVVGDTCLTQADCGPGGVCLRFGNAATGICSQECGTACSVCPTGSACHPLGAQGEEYCLRTCATGTCPSAQQCGVLPTGRGCLPACQTDAQCPVGNQCIQGECINPYVGDCQLCGADGGTGGAWDGGDGTGAGPAANSACGCAAMGAESWFGGLFVMMLAWQRARRHRSR